MLWQLFHALLAPLGADGHRGVVALSDAVTMSQGVSRLGLSPWLCRETGQGSVWPQHVLLKLGSFSMGLGKKGLCRILRGKMELCHLQPKQRAGVFILRGIERTCGNLQLGPTGTL